MAECTDGGCRPRPVAHFRPLARFIVLWHSSRSSTQHSSRFGSRLAMALVTLQHSSHCSTRHCERTTAAAPSRMVRRAIQLSRATVGRWAEAALATVRGRMPDAEVGRKTAKSPASWSAEEPLFNAEIMPELARQCQCECGHWRGFPLRNQPNSLALFGANATACRAWPPIQVTSWLGGSWRCWLGWPPLFPLTLFSSRIPISNSLPV